MVDETGVLEGSCGNLNVRQGSRGGVAEMPCIGDSNHLAKNQVG
jgi:hypothetical protein